MATLLRPSTTKKAESDRAYALLRASILSCDFRPGDFLAEMDLARRCRTSRTPIREACNRLLQEGWISRIPHRGYVVKPISIREMVELYEYRRLLECHTAEASARNADKEQVSLLQGIVARENKPIASMKEVLAANETFHLALGEIAGNRKILAQLRLTLEYVHRLDILSTQKDSEWVPHGEILAAIESHDALRARQAMESHINQARDRMLRLFGS